MISTINNTKGLLNDAIVFLKTLTLKKILNSFLLRLSYVASRIGGMNIHWGHIESLSIEPTNLCNLKCPECPSGNNLMTRPRIFLSKTNFEIAINEVSSHLLYLQLFFQGEPFLHPKIYEYISFASAKNIYTSVSTNGQFLSSDNCEKVISSGLHRLIISFDGATQEVYEKYRVGGSLDLVVSGIKDLVKTKRRLNAKTPIIIMQFVVFATNEHQIVDIKKLAHELNVDKLHIKTAQLDNFEKGNHLMPTNKKYSRYRADKSGNFHLNRMSNFKCKRIWNGAVLSADNKLLPCCFDKNAEFSYNQAGISGLQNIWKGEKAKSFRKLVWRKENTIPMCKNCTEGLK